MGGEALATELLVGLLEEHSLDPHRVRSYLALTEFETVERIFRNLSFLKLGTDELSTYRANLLRLGPVVLQLNLILDRLDSVSTEDGHSRLLKEAIGISESDPVFLLQQGERFARLIVQEQDRVDQFRIAHLFETSGSQAMAEAAVRYWLRDFESTDGGRLVARIRNEIVPQDAVPPTFAAALAVVRWPGTKPNLVLRWFTKHPAISGNQYLPPGIFADLPGLSFYRCSVLDFILPFEMLFETHGWFQQFLGTELRFCLTISHVGYKHRL